MWVRGELNPGSSPCKGDIITELDYEPIQLTYTNPLKIPHGIIVVWHKTILTNS